MGSGWGVKLAQVSERQIKNESSLVPSSLLQVAVDQAFEELLLKILDSPELLSSSGNVTTLQSGHLQLGGKGTRTRAGCC